MNTISKFNFRPQFFSLLVIVSLFLQAAVTTPVLAKGRWDGVASAPPVPGAASQDGLPQAAFTNCAVVTQIPVSECNALAAFYNSTNGASWINNTGWLQTDTPCSWFGVTCKLGTNVTGLEFHKNDLSGMLPTELGNLTELQDLVLESSFFTSLPPALGNLTHLTTLNLYGNQLTSLPPELGNLTNLQYLDLTSNQLTILPSELGSLTNLQHLDIYNNHLTSLPSLGNLVNLQYLDLTENHLSGVIPPEFYNLTQLRELYLGNNAFTGSISPEVGNLTQLRGLSLSWTLLSGPIPPELGNLTQLEALSLDGIGYYDGFTGSIPPELGNLTQLQVLELNSNHLTGSIPSSLGKLTKLEWFDLSSNQLTSIPPELGNLTKLRYLNLAGNKLTGSIPLQLSKLTQLDRLYLSGNGFTGSIPPALGNLAKLQELGLDNNHLSGAIPSQLGNLTQLDQLFLNNNQLSGAFPASIIHLANLRKFIFDCQLTSSDPNVIAFIDKIVPGWHSRICYTLTLNSIGANDGFIVESSETSNQGGAMDSVSPTFWLGDDAYKRQFRAILSFNTAALPDTAVISSIILKIKQYGAPIGNNPFNVLGKLWVDIRKGTFGAASLQPGDFSAAASIVKVAAFSKIPSGGWYAVELKIGKSGNVVNKTGLTQLRLYFSLGDNNNSVADYIRFLSGNAASGKPALVIGYTVP